MNNEQRPKMHTTSTVVHAKTFLHSVEGVSRVAAM